MEKPWTRAVCSIFVVLVALGAGEARAQLPIGAEFRANSYTTNSQQTPSVALGSSGSFVVVWQSYGQDGSMSGVFGQRYTSAGGSLGGEFRVNSYTTNIQQAPSVASDSAGNFVVVWESYAQNVVGFGVFGQRYASTGGPLGAEFQISASTSGSQARAKAASDSAGNLVVVWRDSNMSTVFGQRFASSGTPAGTTFFVTTNPTAITLSPAVAADSAGNFIVVWPRAPGPVPPVIYGQRFSSSGAPAGTELTISGGNGYAPSVGASANGFLVAWQAPAQDGSGAAILATRYASTGAVLASNFRVNSYTTGDQYSSAVAGDANGNFIVSWAGPGDGGGTGVFAQGFAPNGAPAGPEFRANTFTAGNQSAPAVSLGPPGAFVVAWSSDAQDGNLAGVFGQGFCMPLVSASVSVTGSTSVCPNGTAGTATVTDVGGGTSTHVWGFRTVSMTGPITFIPGQTGTSYVINGANFPGQSVYYLVCVSMSGCGSSFVVSNETPILVSDPTAPVVSPPSSSTVAQTVCQ